MRRQNRLLLLLAVLSSLFTSGSAAHADPLPLCEVVGVKVANTVVAVMAMGALPSGGETSVNVTCWLQTSDQFGVGEISGTRRTCGSIVLGVAACADYLLLVPVSPGATVYKCGRVDWEPDTKSENLGCKEMTPI